MQHGFCIVQVVDVEVQVGDHHMVGVVPEEAVAEQAVVQRAAALEHVTSVVNQVTLAMLVPTRSIGCWVRH